MEVPYTRNIKTLRRHLREALRELRDLVREESLVSVSFSEISQRIRRVILRETERVLKCRLTRAIGDLQLSARFFRRRILIGVNIGTVQPLYRRWYTRFKSRASLNPVIAAAMCLVAGRHDFVMDPFAGSLTIPLEYYRMWKPRTIICADHSCQTLSKAMLNVLSIGYSAYSKIEVLCGDYLKLSLRRSVSCIVTDPPRGLRLRVPKTFYKKIATKFAYDLDEHGVLVLPVFRSSRKMIEHALTSSGFKVSFPVVTVQGGEKVFIVRAVRQH